MGREKYDRQCRRKSRHENYLTALHHAIQLDKSDMAIYPCGFCGGFIWGMDSPACGTLQPRA